MHHKGQETAVAPQRELIITVHLHVVDYGDPPTTQRIRDYLDTALVESEYHESDMHVHGVTLVGWGPQGSGLEYDEARS